MKSYRVNIPASINALIWDQVLYIARDSLDNAIAWEQRLRREISRIGAMPTSFAVDEDASARIGRKVRKMVFERTYLVFCTVSEQNQSVEIVNFRHGARLPKFREA